MLWRKHLAKVPDEEIDLNVEETLDAVQDAEMNGREISNSITTARTLAKSEGNRLNLEYLTIILQIWNQFEETLVGLKKEEEETGVSGVVVMR
jgi:hypothetical protein